MNRANKSRGKIRLISSRFLFRMVISISVCVGLYALSLNITEVNPILLIQGLPIIWRMLSNDLFPPAWSYARTGLQALLETWNIALFATTFSAFFSLPFAFLATKKVNPHLVAYQVTRTFLTVLRTIPDIILAILTVAFIGMGAVSGVVALTIYSTTVLAKMLSESIDGMEHGPLEAVRSSGGNLIQVIRYAVMPQLFPAYISYVLYVLELNIKTSVIIGFIGAGGIGQLIHRNVQFFRYERLTIVLLILFVVISLIDWLSNVVRRQLE